MPAKKVTKLKSPRTTRSTSKKKATKPSKGKSNVPNVVHPKIREQMIEEAAYFKALNREFQGDCCEEDWLEAETEIDAFTNGDYQDDLCVEDWLEVETETDNLLQD